MSTSNHPPENSSPAVQVDPVNAASVLRQRAEAIVQERADMLQPQPPEMIELAMPFSTICSRQFVEYGVVSAFSRFQQE